MPRFVIGSLTSERWYTQADGLPWLPADSVLSDALRDLRTTDGVLSVYEIPQPEDEALVRRIVVAIAAGMQRSRDIGFLLFERTAVEGLAIRINDAVPGETGDAHVNALHRDLEQLSARKLAALAEIMAHGDDGEILAKDFRDSLKAGIVAQHLDKNKVHKELRKEIGLES